jgi:hypothetical protein
MTRVQDIQNKVDANSCVAAGLSAGCTAIFVFVAFFGLFVVECCHLVV